MSPNPILESSLPTNLSISSTNPSAAVLYQFPLRCGGSPLRPSQWVGRGGCLSTPRRLKRAPDRFIPPRPLPNATMQSFGIGRPGDRLLHDGTSTVHDRLVVNPFSRRLPQSRRMSEELRGLREAHAMLTNRMNPDRRYSNTRFRQGTVALEARQVSAGAVWNVGGRSAASDTVLAVSNGGSALFGRGTNAPLYTSMFLQRSDPDAELEAYERRLALALETHRINRTPEQSTLNPTFFTVNLGKQLAWGHVWRDGAWTRDAPTSRSFFRMQNLVQKNADNSARSAT